VLGGRVRSAPIINGRICGGRASITMGGHDAAHMEREAEALVAVLRQGSLPAGGAIEKVEWLQPADVARQFQRGCLLLGLFAGVTVGFALAPYLSMSVIGLLALAIRTFSWTSESARERQWRRGRSRWYDGPLTALTSPWYLLVATGGTLMLLLWSAALAFLVGLAYLLFNLPMIPGLMSMGAVLAFSMWWGPGSRRLRVPTRQLVVRATRWTPVGWVVLLGLAALLAPSAGAESSPSAYADRLVSLINQARADQGLRALTVTSGTSTVALNWTHHLDSQQSLSHNPDLGPQLEAHGSPNWTAYGENVGQGPTSSAARQLFRAYMHSPPHRANILDPAYKYIGLWTRSGHVSRWNTLDFVGRTSSSYNYGYGPTRRRTC